MGLDGVGEGAEGLEGVEQQPREEANAASQGVTTEGDGGVHGGRGVIDGYASIAEQHEG